MTRPKVCRRCQLRHSPYCQEPRWPVQPLLELCPTNAYELFSVNAETMRRYHREGLPESVADRWAVRIGRHPSEVWPEWVEAGLSVVDEQFLSGGWRQAWESTNRKEQAA